MKQGAKEAHSGVVTPLLPNAIRASTGLSNEYTDRDHPSTIRKDHAGLSKFHPNQVEAERARINSFNLSSSSARASRPNANNNHFS